MSRMIFAISRSCFTYLARNKVLVPKHFIHGDPLLLVQVVLTLHNGKVRAIQQAHAQEGFVLGHQLDGRLSGIDRDVNDGACLGLSECQVDEVLNKLQAESFSSHNVRVLSA
jgi:hypothetical protein